MRPGDSGCAGGEILTWDVTTRTRLAERKAHSNFVSTITFNHTGDRLVSGSQDGTIAVWNAERLQPLGSTLARHKGRVNSVVFSPDDKMFVSGSQDTRVIVWAPDNEQQPSSKVVERHRSSGVRALSANGSAVTKDGQIVDLRTGGSFGSLDDISSVESVTLSRDGRVALSVDRMALSACGMWSVNSRSVLPSEEIPN